MPQTRPDRTAAASAFALPDHLSAKADPALIAADERHLAAVADALARTTADLTERLAAVRRTPGRSGQAAVDRDAEIHRLSARLRALRRFTIDLCLGRMVPEDGSEPVYVGRLGLTDPDGRRLLVDWRSPAAEPFFAATPARPRGLASRRRYRWTGARVTDYWDEALTEAGLRELRRLGGTAALDDRSAFLASLGAVRTARMRDVLGTIQADQDAIVRADARGPLVVDGGPGTGKTVVALHRVAYLLHADPRMSRGRGGVLVIGPHRRYLDHVADVLPNLGEDEVRTVTLRDLVPEGAAALPETDPEVARLKGSAAMVAAVEPAVRFSERPPTEGLLVETPWADLWLSAADWAEAVGSPDPGTPHNEARDVVRATLVEILVDRLRDQDEDVAPEAVRAHLARHADLDAALGRAWPVIDPADLVADLWSVPAYLRLCAPGLTADQVRLLQRPDPHAWTVADLPLLDAARRRLGDPLASRRARARSAERAAEQEYRERVTEDLVRADDDGESVMTMLRGADLSDALLQPAADDGTGDPLAGPFAHVVVDEAQELTDAEWQMVLARCPVRSLTVVGDRAQARAGFVEPWTERLARVGLPGAAVATLSISYRTPAEVMAVAEPVIRAVLPDVPVPTAVRTGGAVEHRPSGDLAAVVRDWLAADEGVVGVITADPARVALPAHPRVTVLDPVQAKGLEFDLVVLDGTVGAGTGGGATGSVAGAVDRYVAMTRATRRLVLPA